jgi:hypothetical protein
VKKICRVVDIDKPSLPFLTPIGGSKMCDFLVFDLFLKEIFKI